jgi:hypothetical protein
MLRPRHRSRDGKPQVCRYFHVGEPRDLVAFNDVEREKRGPGSAVATGSEPAFRRNTAERVYISEAAHNPEVAGSNPAPAINLHGADVRPIERVVFPPKRDSDLLGRASRTGATAVVWHRLRRVERIRNSRRRRQPRSACRRSEDVPREKRLPCLGHGEVLTLEQPR